MAVETLLRIAETIARGTESLVDSASSNALLSALKVNQLVTGSFYQEVAKRAITFESSNDILAAIRVLIASYPVLPIETHSHYCKLLSLLMKRLDDPEGQKSVYRFVSELHRASLPRDKLCILFQLLKSFNSLTSPHALKQRLRALLDFSADLDDDLIPLFVQAFIPDVLISSHDASSAIRILAKSLLVRFCRLSSGKNTFCEGLISLVVAGLAGSSTDMQSSSILSLGLIIYNLWDEIDFSTLRTIIETVFSFRAASSTQCQIVRSLIRFIRFVLRKINPFMKAVNITDSNSEILKLCAAYYGQEIVNNVHSKKSLRMCVRRLTAKIGKKVGWETLRRDFVPKEHWPLIRYAERICNREGSKKRSRNSKEAASSDEEEEIELMQKLSTRDFSDNVSKPKIVVEEDKKNEVRVRKGLADIRRPIPEILKNKSRKQHEIIGMPDSAKNFGDGKKKGQSLDPFAYVRLNPSLSKEKHKFSSIKSFKKIFKKSRKSSPRT